MQVLGRGPPKACNRASAAAPDGVRVEDETCLEIRPVATPSPTPPKPATPVSDGLTLWVGGSSNPIRAGKELTYEIRVTNKATTAQQQISVTAILPDGMAPSPLGTKGPSDWKPDHQTVRFDPVAELRPSESLTYRVRVRRAAARHEKLPRRVATAAAPEPAVEVANTEVLEQ